MFRRLPSGLPADPVYPSDLEGLGYFINEEKDEIRSIENPKAYFKFFLTKNERYNIVQREAMNEIIRNLVRSRLEALSLTTLHVPLNSTPAQPHLPIYVTPNLSTCTRLIVLFAESTQDIGIFAHRIIGGRGGINVGSAVNLVSCILSSASTNNEDVGIILANTGQLRWVRRLKKTVTQTSWWSLPQPSAVSHPYRFSADKNTIPGNRTVGEHVNHIFNSVITTLVNPSASIQLIGVSEGAFQVSKFLDDQKNWETWGNSGRVKAFASISTYWQETDFTNEEFRGWFEKRGRVYLPSFREAGEVICGPTGSRKVAAYGCNAFALGEEYYSECMLPRGYKVVVDWLSEVARKDGEGGEGYMNERLEIVDDESEDEQEGFAQDEDEQVGKPAWESDDEDEGGAKVKELGEGDGSRDVEVNLQTGPPGATEGGKESTKPHGPDDIDLS